MSKKNLEEIKKKLLEEVVNCRINIKKEKEEYFEEKQETI